MADAGPDAGPSRSTSTEPMLDAASAIEAIRLAELRDILWKLDSYSAQHLSLLGKAVFTMGKLEKRYKKMRMRFDTRYQKMEETQCRILEALEKIYRDSSKEKSVVSATCNALKQLVNSLRDHGENLSATTKATQARMATFFSTRIGLLPRDQIPLPTKLLSIHTIPKTRWQATQHLDWKMTAAYPWLSSAVASCYHVALLAWFVDSVSELYLDAGNQSKYKINKLEIIEDYFCYF